MLFIVDCEKDSEFNLQISGVKLSAETVETPIIAIANYVFNGLREQSISINNGTVSEGCIKILADPKYIHHASCLMSSVSATDVNIISRMKLEWSYKPIQDIDSHFPDPVLRDLVNQSYFWNSINPSYLMNNETLNVLLPVGALRFVHALETLSNGNFVLIAADKAHAHEEDLRLTKENPHIATHGSFSMMANFHALRQYFLSRGGSSFHTPYYTGLQVAAFSLGETPLSEFQFAWEVE